jgi:outer membrane protein OmpA-like peptidoglycan-associated protein
MFENEKLPWVTSYFSKNGYRIQQSAAKLVLELIENNTQSLAAECSRFFVLFPKDHEITEDDVESVLTHNREENAFSLSTGDLMAGLLFIFILLLMGALLQVQEKAEQDEEIVKRYDQIKTQLYIDLQDEFKEDLTVWRATIDSTLCIRFQEPSMLFDEGLDELKPNFKVILNDFFPRYIAVLSRPQYKDNIVEIRIEGHTNSNGDYYSNMKLSQDRTRAVLQYCFSLMKKKDVNWLRGLVTANGLSSSHLILTKDGHEDKNLSRRVEFRVRTNAEKHLEDIADKRFNRKKND